MSYWFDLVAPTVLTTDAIVTTVKAATHAGPNMVVYDTKSGLSITESTSTVLTSIIAGQSPKILSVADSSRFPNSKGFLVVGFGQDYQCGPIPYIGRAGATQVILDPTYVFRFDIPAGAKVNLLTDRSVENPSSPQTDGAFYVTGSSCGRVAAEETVRKVTAAGVEVSAEIQYPGDHGLAREGEPTSNATRLSDIVNMYAGDDPDTELPLIREGR